MQRPTVSKATFTAAVIAISVLGLSCLDSSGPERSQELAFQAVFGDATTGIVPLDFVRATLTRPNDGTLVLDTVIHIPPGQDSLSVSLTVPVGANPETFLLLLEFVTPAGRVAFVGGPVEVTTSTTGSPVPLDVELSYTGVGANAADVEISRLMLAIGVDQSITLTASALDSSGNAILGTPIIWSALDPEIADVPDPKEGTVVGISQGSARIVATLLTGQADTVTVAVGGSLPDEIRVVSGDNQSQQIGEDLDEPIVVEVLSNGEPFPDAEVVFEVTSGGGTLSPQMATTDAQGMVSAIWTLGPNLGTQTGRAYVMDVAELEVSFSATGQPQPTPGRDVVVFNDINVFDETAMQDPNNLLLARNLVNFASTGPRNDGTVVWWDNGRGSSCGTSCDVTTMATMVGEIESQGFTVLQMNSESGSLIDIDPEVKAIFFWNLQVEFTVDEINTLKDFAEDGGRIIYIGEHEGFLGAQGIVVENQFLLDMGAVMTNTGGFIDCGRVVAQAFQLREHQVTAGLDSLQMGCASEIVPGEQDFVFLFDMGDTIAIAGVAKVDVTPLPAPTAAFLDARRQRFHAEVARLRRAISVRSSSTTGTGTEKHRPR